MAKILVLLIVLGVIIYTLFNVADTTAVKLLNKEVVYQAGQCILYDQGWFEEGCCRKYNWKCTDVETFLILKKNATVEVDKSCQTDCQKSYFTDSEKLTNSEATKWYYQGKIGLINNLYGELRLKTKYACNSSCGLIKN